MLTQTTRSVADAATPAHSITIPQEVFDLAVEGSRFFQTISGHNPEVHARELLNTSRTLRPAELLQRYCPLKGAKTLEVGSGYGLNLAVWVSDFGADAFGIEPDGVGFGTSLKASRLLLAANGIEPDRIVNAVGEQIPFPDNAFDIVYSASTLEHVQDPQRVLGEAVRVLKPGGILQFEVPNYLSYLETHYLILQPPIFSTSMLAWWVRLRGRDPEFAKTIRTISPAWCRGAVKSLAERYTLSTITLGEEIFLERFAQPWNFELEKTAGAVGRLVRAVQAINLGNWIGRLIVAAQGFYPDLLDTPEGEPMKSAVFLHLARRVCPLC